MNDAAIAWPDYRMTKFGTNWCPGVELPLQIGDVRGERGCSIGGRRECVRSDVSAEGQDIEW